MKKRLYLKHLCFLFGLLFVLSACSAEKSCDFEMENGEKIKVTMDTGSKYDLLTDGSSIIVRKEGTDVLNGLIITKDGFEANAQVIIESQDGIEIIEAIPENAPSLFIYQYNVEEETEIDFLFQIENSEYAGVFMSFSTYEEAKAAFDRVSFVVSR